MAKKSNKKSARHGMARANPAASQIAKGVGMTALAAGIGAGVTLLGTRVLQMKNAQGAPRLSANQQMLAQGVVALGLAAGGAAVKPGKLQGVLNASAVVMGGSAAMNYAIAMRVPQRIEGAVTGNQPSAGLYNPMMALPSGDARPPYYNSMGQLVSARG